MSFAANLLTLLRIALIPAMVFAYWTGPPYGALAAFWIFALAALTDVMDGLVARATATTSSFGRMLDPIADKLLTATAILMLTAADIIAGSLLVAAMIILAREILVSGLREYLATLNVPLPVTRLARVKTFVQMLALALLIVAPNWGGAQGPVFLIGAGLLWAAAAVTVFTGSQYLRAGLEHSRRMPNASAPEDRT